MITIVDSLPILFSLVGAATGTLAYFTSCKALNYAKIPGPPGKIVRVSDKVELDVCSRCGKSTARCALKNNGDKVCLNCER